MKLLKRYLITILIIISIACNAITVSQNANQINMTNKAIICLASGVETIANSVIRLAKEVTKLKYITSTNQKAALEALTMYLEAIKIHQTEIDNIKTTIADITEKPSYQYLKSVTVFIEAKKISEIEMLCETLAKIVDIKPNYDKMKPEWLGTGVVVKTGGDYTYILTNRHVAGGDEAYFKDGSQGVYLFISDLRKNRIPAGIVALHETQDLALIRIKGQIKNKVAIKGITSPNITERSYTVGHSAGRPYLYGEGVFSGTDNYADYYQLPCMPGCSGSGVFNSKGELTGLCFSLSLAGNIFSPIADVAHVNTVKSIYIEEFINKFLN